MKRSRVPGWLATAVCVLVGSAAVSACSADPAPDTAPGATSTSAGAPTVADADDVLPSVSLYVLDGRGGEGRANLQDIFPAAKPVVLWFWAPF